MATASSQCILCMLCHHSFSALRVHLEECVSFTKSDNPIRTVTQSEPYIYVVVYTLAVQHCTTLGISYMCTLA